MIPPEIRQRAELLREQGRGVRWIARHLELSRNTVREILDPARKEGRKAKHPSRAQSSILDPYKKRIGEILEEDEAYRRKNRSAKPLTTNVILREIRQLGYRGGHTVLDDYLRTLRGPKRRSRKPFCRFETAPAEEAQQDWSPYRVEIDGKLVRIEVFSLILAWSRHQFLRAYLDQRQPTLLWGHAAAFHYFDGVPWKILYDRQSTITPCDLGGKPLITEKVRTFAQHYGFEVALCQPGDKERKGKVERPFHYFETSFLPRRKFASLEDLNDQIRRWLDGLEYPGEGNHRVHGTTGEVPYERWREEKRYLLELPTRDFIPRRIEQRGVNKDCTVSVDGTLYTVPAVLVEKGVRSVWVSIGDEDLVVHDHGGEVVARHKLSRHDRLVIDPEHYEHIRRRQRKVSLPELERQFLERFADTADFLDALKQTMRSIAPIHLREILALARRYRRQDVVDALQEALRDGTATAGYVRQLLERTHPTGHLGQIATETPRGLALGPVDPGAPEGYGAIFQNASKETNR